MLSTYFLLLSNIHEITGFYDANTSIHVCLNYAVSKYTIMLQRTGPRLTKVVVVGLLCKIKLSN